ncbi:DUF4139 domain-containing protein [Streptomyces asoensis]|uniref:DUF4139 domain-containing protein n=1 Tax=Streptomyces asoensis TaxID=249586 RepID=A0A6M4WJC5_9ACTN|nr:DUF4139 domain-containing protein [Streptomyces asoensis]QJS99304.1 DUF4139 domain-containing protein [Streptomyces asoensis]
MTARTALRWGSTLDSVVVYAQGAVCRRLASGSVPPDGRVRVTGLPRSLDPGSLRARVTGTPGVRVTEARVEVEAEPLAETAPDALRREVERLLDECAAARGRRDRHLSLIEEVKGLRPVPPARRRDDPHRRTPVDAWLELAEFVDERLTGLHTRLVELEEALGHAEHALSVAADRLARASTDAPAAHVETTVSAVLTLDGTGDAEVELEYGVPGAVWVPTYRLTYRRDDSSGRLVLRASVAQRTGEDWTGVRIALATADLRRRTDLPRLRSVRIGRRQPAPLPSGWREPPTGLSDLFAGYDMAPLRPATTVTPLTPGGVPVAAAAAVGSTSGPVPPMQPSPRGYGESLAAAPPAYGAPTPPMQSAPQAYGAPPPVPPPGSAGSAYPEPFGGGTNEFAQPVPSRPGSGGRGRARSLPPAAPAAMAPPAPARAAAPPAPAAPGSAAPGQAAAPAAGPPRPSGAELDYTALVLCGPDVQGGRRGLLFPDSPFDPVAAEHRRRAEAVTALPLPGHAVRPRESAGSFDHRFDAVARADIPSDGTWHTVTVGEIPVGLRTEYLCVPSVEQTVYATLVLSNSTDQALLAGPVEVTAGDDFLLTTALPTLAPGGERRVGLGPAQGVRVTRRTNLHESTSGLRNSTTVLDHRVHVELANQLGEPVTVEVRERVPVTSDADIRIEERADWTAPRDGAGPEQHAPGTRVWRVDLPAGATTALDGGYEIRIASAKTLAGGNRRS